MNRMILIGAGVILAVLAIVASQTFFTVHQAAQALVLQFGQPIRVIKEPGLNVKIPFVQTVDYYDKRVLDFDGASQEVIASDQKRLVVDAFARYRIVDALKFRQTIQTEFQARNRLGAIINSSLRRVLGSVPLSDVLTQQRAALMLQIREQVNREASSFGIDLVDVRIKRADLPEENSQAIFRRMQTERDREAKDFRARGEEVAQRIRAGADRERTVILAEANRRSQVLRGEGDAFAVKVFADAFGRDQEFYAFYRTMQAYREALQDNSTSMVLSPDSQFFDYFRDGGTTGVRPRQR